MAGPLGEVLVSGPYTVAYNGVALGLMEGDGGLPTLEQTSEGEPIANTSFYGKTEISTIYQGVNAFATFTAMEYKPGTVTAWWPWATAGLIGLVGRQLDVLAAPLVLTVVAGSPAVGAPNTITANKAIAARSFNTKLLFGPTLRKLPIRLKLYPYDVLGGGVLTTIGFWSVT